VGALDPFRIIDELEDVLLDVMVSRLEVRGKHWFFQKVLREYLDAMDIDSADTVLDMGCGTGVAARTIARRANFSGRVTGRDLGPYLVEAATRLANEEGLYQVRMDSFAFSCRLRPPVVAEVRANELRLLAKGVATLNQRLL
jgi:2-polyprenyl-3-methyl-5-hydroxy-6-metoxy-1,4-benzoquinol methylase